ncbi:hypothetical protein GCM10010306_013380 [Streptomyces umbrinus]|nr:hypothetical protein GCM10010306_013380 [Streptomyces umbrinus]
MLRKTRMRKRPFEECVLIGVGGEGAGDVVGALTAIGDRTAGATCAAGVVRTVHAVRDGCGRCCFPITHSDSGPGPRVAPENRFFSPNSAGQRGFLTLLDELSRKPG